MTALKAAIYARFSTDLQSERSIDDQVALCRAYCERDGLTVVATFHDRAKSGASLFGRQGLLDLMQAAKASHFQVLVVEHTDRIARSMRDLPDVYERLKFLGVQIRAVHSGAAPMNTAMIGLLGLVGQMQREDGAEKVKRGMAGVVREGRHAGGRAYGYRAVPGQAGVLAIDPGEASILRRIFAAYLGGATPRSIAGALNRDGVAPPRGRAWNASTINGNLQRCNGILQNDLYGGLLVWNKVRMVKDPETGRRVSRPNPVHEHQVIDVPELAIVDAATWRAVRAYKAERGHAQGGKGVSRKRMLSGLLRCGVCGSGMSAHDKDRAGKVRLRCSAVRESGRCAHKRTYYAEQIEAATVWGLQEELQHPKLIAAYVKAYHLERKRLAGDAIGQRLRLSTRIGEIGRELERMVDAIAQGLATASTIGARILALEAERHRLGVELASIETKPDVIALHPAALKLYLAQLENLSAALAVGKDLSIGEAAAVFRSLIESVIVYPVVARAKLDIEIRGFLSVLLEDPNLAPSRKVCGFEVVAEEGLEPPTRGL